MDINNELKSVDIMYVFTLNNTYFICIYTVKKICI